MNDLMFLLGIAGAVLSGGMVIRLVVGGRRWRIWIMRGKRE